MRTLLPTAKEFATVIVATLLLHTVFVIGENTGPAFTTSLAAAM